MARAQLIITAVVVEGRSKSEVARDYGVSRFWVQQLVNRFDAEGAAAFQPRSRRPHSSPHAVDADTEEMIIRLRKELSKQGLDAGAETIAAHLARQAPDEGGRPAMPAVSTIWRILSRRGFVRPQPQKRPRSSWQIVLRRAAQRAVAGRHHPLAAGRRHRGGDLEHPRRPLPAGGGQPRPPQHHRLVMWSPASAKPLANGESRPGCSPTFKLGGALKVPGLSGRRCEDRGVRHPPIVVA